MKYPPHIMVSGVITWWGLSKIVLYEPGSTVDANNYIDTLHRFHMPDLRELFEGTEFIYMHVSFKTIEYIF